MLIPALPPIVSYNEHMLSQGVSGFVMILESRSDTSGHDYILSSEAPFARQGPELQADG